MKDLLDNNLYNAIASQFVIENIEEVRLRANAPVVICALGKNYLLKSQDGYYNATDYELNYAISRATQNSLYAVNDQIQQMFIGYKGGIRIGITGDVVCENSKVKTIKYINSLNIRLPHQVKDFAKIALNFIYNNGKINSTLVVSEPGAGKTTLLRDICRGICSYSKVYNVLLVDERYEIACCNKGRPMLNVGLFTDIISGGNKKFAFNQAVRSLKPDVIITDELASEEDYIAVRQAVNSGVSVVASVHAKNQLELMNNSYIKQMLLDGIFTRIIVLSSQSPNRYQGIYDNKLKCLYMPY